MAERARVEDWPTCAPRPASLDLLGRVFPIELDRPWGEAGGVTRNQ